MQILKGDAMKSATVQHILDNTHSICFMYCNEALYLDGFYMDSKENSLIDLKNCLQDYINNDMKDTIFDYMILYTNNTEDELSDIIEWLKEQEQTIGVRCIMVTCYSIL